MTDDNHYDNSFSYNSFSYNNAKSSRRRNMEKKKKFNKYKRNGHNQSKGHNYKSQKMIDIFHDTLNHFSSMKTSDISDSTLYDIYNLNNEINDNMPTFETVYEVKNQDTLDMALDFCKDGLRPLVLNMASDYKAGGGVRSGKTAQEECIFRRTNAIMTHPAKWYPLESTDVIYSPEVWIVKNSKYELLGENSQSVVGMIAVPALRKPKLVDGEYQNDDRYLMTSKIESIFKIAIEQGHDSLVLGALGCGVFHNPPTEVVAIFKTMTNYYGKYFKKIGFAVLCVNDSDNENLKIFTKKY